MKWIESVDSSVQRGILVQYIKMLQCTRKDVARRRATSVLYWSYSSNSLVHIDWQCRLLCSGLCRDSYLYSDEYENFELHFKTSQHALIANPMR